MLLGAHVSTAGGVRNAPIRAGEIGANAIQVFTKQPNRWAEPVCGEEDVRGFTGGVRERGIGFTNSHDSYLINLATADPVLRERSLESFRAELRRAVELDLDAVVTHPGNATDGDRFRGLAQNAALVEQGAGGGPRPHSWCCWRPRRGRGEVLGATFEELAEMIERYRPGAPRGGWGCARTPATCTRPATTWWATTRAWWRTWRTAVGLDRLRLFHLNDPQCPFGSRKDRHAEIGEGSLGDAPFRSIMNDERFAAIPKVLETPKGDDHTAADRRNLARLRSFLG